MEGKLSLSKYEKVLLSVLLVSIFVSIIATYRTMLVDENYTIFSDPETVPESSDFLSGIFGISE